MGSEDFGNYTQLLPGLLIRLGMGKSSPPLHTSSFDFCDNSLATGITILAGLAMKATENDFKISKG
jgi:metal-dependent amidase/aminoacylase/carboxypeptidase family protein